MWQHNYEPVAGSLGVSALVAAMPILVLFLMLGVLRKPAWMAAVAALGSALLVALVAYRMPPGLALVSTVYGAAYGVFPIAWIVFTSIMLYRLAVDTGKFEIIKDSVGGLTEDRRLQAMFIAFSFGAFIEGAAGFGAPVAVSGAMLAGLGFNPFYAAGICLLANTAPVAFGSIGIPVTTLAAVTGLPVLPLSGMVGTLCAMISIIIPGYLIVVMAGARKALEVLPAIIACGVSFAGVQFYVSRNMGPELTDILSSLTCIVVMVAVLKLWKPKNIFRLEGDTAASVTLARHSGGAVFMAWVPYLLLVVFVLIWGEPDIKPAINRFADSLLPAFLNTVPGTGPLAERLMVPGLHNLITRIPPVVAAPAPYAALYELNWLSASGTACLLATLATALVLRVRPGHGRQRLRSDVQAAQDGDPHHRVHARSGVCHELLGDDVHAGPGARQHRCGVSVLQRRARVDGRVPDRKRHVGQRALRQPAGGDGERARPQSDPDGQCELGRRCDGQDDLGAEHRRGHSRHRDDA